MAATPKATFITAGAATSARNAAAAVSGPSHGSGSAAPNAGVSPDRAKISVNVETGDTIFVVLGFIGRASVRRDKPAKCCE
jgi:hypothetical protein